MLRTYKYLLRPTAEQDKAIDFLLWQSRLIYNMALEQRIATYAHNSATPVTLNSADQWAYFRDLRHANPDTFGKLNAKSVQQLLRRLDKAFQAFYRRNKAKKEKPGFPRFKSSSRFKSIEYKYGNGCKLINDKNGRRYFYIMNAGNVKICFHRNIPEGAKIKHAVIRRNNERWYVFFQIELPDVVIKHPHPRRSVGIDIGIYSVVALSNGQTIENPRWLRNNLAKLRIIQRKASRQVKGSHRQSETYKQIAKLHERIANVRGDFFHKLSRQLATNYKMIALEDMPLAFMNQNKHLSFSSYDAGWGEFRRMLVYKAEEAGGQVFAVNPSKTTQKCSRCGRIVKKSWRQRVHKCSHCGLKLDRDVNAARNIIHLAKSLPPGRGGQA